MTDDWPDQKIRSTALWYVRNHSMDPETWRWTLLGEAHPQTAALADLEPGELALVSFFLSPESWYLFTTRRVLGTYAGQQIEARALDVVEDRFRNFKGTIGGVATEVMTLRLACGAEVRLEYETFLASMGPIYYFRYWRVKYPILHRLRDGLGD
jgi:hypothetical protein